MKRIILIAWAITLVAGSTPAAYGMAKKKWLRVYVVGCGGYTEPERGQFYVNSPVDIRVYPDDGCAVESWEGTKNDSSRELTNRVIMGTNWLSVQYATVYLEPITKFPDINLRRAIREYLGYDLRDDIIPTDMRSFTSLDLSSRGIVNLQGLDQALNLTTLNLSDNSVSDISVLSQHTNLTYLDLRANPLNEAAFKKYLPQIQHNNPGIELYYDTDQYFELTVIIHDGIATADPNSGFYKRAEVVIITVTPGVDFTLKSWQGTDDDSSIALTNTLTMKSDRTVNIYAKIPRIAVTSSNVAFACPVGGPNPEPQKMSIWNSGIFTLNWQITEDCDWLDVSPMSGQSSGGVNEVVVIADANGLDFGDYKCQLLIWDPNADNSPLPVTVNLHVGKPVIEVTPTLLWFYYQPGGSIPGPKSLRVSNIDVSVLNWQIVENCNWLEVSPTQGQSSGEENYLDVSVDPNGLAVGIYTYNLTFIDPNASNSPQYVTVRLEVKGSVIEVVPETLYFFYSPDIPEPNAQTLAISNAGIQTLQWSITGDCDWLSLHPLSGASRGEANDVVVTIDWGQITADQKAPLTISDPNSVNKSKQVNVVVHHTEMPVLRVPSIFPTIQAAIDHAEDGDTVIVEPGRYTGPGNCNITFRGKAITVRSTDPNDFDGVAATVIDCNNLGRGFYFHSGEDANSVLSGFTITNAIDYLYAGGICCRESSPVISNCIIENNSARVGAGIYSRQGNPVIRNCIIVRNSARYDGGGVYISSGSYLTIDNCIISSNSAGNSGGGIYISGIYDMSINNCIISGNKSGDLGGGLYCLGGDVVFTGCTIVGNITANKGGGIYSTWSSNHVVLNSILWGNSAPVGPEIAVFPYYYESPIVSVSYSDILGGKASIYTDEARTLNWGLGNIDTDPCFANPGYWDPNGTAYGTSDDFWIDGDYHLKSENGRWDPNSQSWALDDLTSSCIDAGDPNSDWRAELWPHGKRANIGVYGGTKQASVSPNDVGDVADLDFDDFVYRTDIPFFVEQWLIERFFLPADMNRDGIVDFPDFAIFAWNWERPPVPCPASKPSPFDGAAAVSPTTLLSWTSDPNARWHDVYLGTEYPGEFQRRQTTTTFDPNTLENDTWYFWRVDDLNPAGTTTGPVWGFKTGSPASSPDPYNGATGISTTPVLKWQAGIGAISHDVYFGTSNPGTFQGNQVETTFNPGSLSKSTTYYWRIDEVTLERTTTGSVWSFTTGSGGGR